MNIFFRMFFRIFIFLFYSSQKDSKGKDIEQPADNKSERVSIEEKPLRYVSESDLIRVCMLHNQTCFCGEFV